MDVNLLSSFTQQELDKYQATFELFDTDKDGFVSRQDTALVIRALGVAITEQEVDAIMNQLDKQNRGALDFPQVLGVLAEWQNDRDTERDLITAFQVFDTAGNGRLGIQILYRILINLGEVMSTREADRLILEADSDGSGSVDYRDFARRMCHHGNPTEHESSAPGVTFCTQQQPATITRNQGDGR